MNFQVPKYNGIGNFDSSNTAGAGVIRNPDKSIDVGQVNTPYVNNAGGTSAGVAAFTVTGTLDKTCTNVTVSGASGAYALNLPVASASAGYEYKIVLINAAHAVTITSNGADNIVSSGVGTATTFALSTIGQQVIIWCDGTQWYVK